ncbi:hypothetical protein [Candidatus Mycoplasma mahonii]|uniref:hypothetical protein n=1 Tax=Candidatus Mycoplasma mahonii TaxID=3004105 RepID=UPI0026E9B260|nr:hypothetical protein [Candidatus Mycoplasma mahonii]WKX02335.1 hypothetical protein O3I44_02935 [Candidatus Mycoplasma mahonii]
MFNIIIAIILLTILIFSVFGAFGALINGEKGLSIIKGIIIGALLPFLGLLILSLQKQSTKNVVDEMYTRGLIKKDEHDKTMEILINNVEKVKK